MRQLCENVDYTTLSVPIPFAIHSHTRLMAKRSRLPLHKYISLILESAEPVALDPLAPPRKRTRRRRDVNPPSPTSTTITITTDESLPL